MRRLVLLIGFAMLATRAAHAEQPRPAANRVFALGVNVPLIWPWSFAASGWIGLDEHYALRGNFARYRGSLVTASLGSFDSEGEGDAGGTELDFGHTTDVSLGVAYYPRRVLHGISLELGALCRFHRLRDRIDDHNMALEQQRTNVYSARFLIGWTGYVSDSWFLAAGLGAALGYERGWERVFVRYDRSDGGFREVFREGDVSRADLSMEAYLRVGIEFDWSSPAPSAQSVRGASRGRVIAM